MILPNKHLIDGDIICYTVGFGADKEGLDETQTIKSADSFIESLLFLDDADFFLSGSTNFRKKYPWYKANRKDAPKPRHIQALRKHLIDTYEAVVSVDEEADDLMGKAQKDHTTCITTTDKDLDQIPGWHYNWRKNRLYWVSRNQGLMFFYHQMITGDTADNVKGIPKKGPKSAENVLSGLSPDEARNAVAKAYGDAGISDQLKENAEVLWIRR